MSEYATLTHQPVMLNEVLHYLNPKKGEVYIDCTFGAGGYSKAILNQDNTILYALDQDPAVLPIAKKLQEQYPERFCFIQGNFSELDNLMSAHNIEMVDAIIMDIGVSSMQLEAAERGFSFMHDGPLDMRMNKEGISAADFVNNANEQDIANILYQYGNERRSRAVARKVVERRKLSPITTTKQLADIIRSVVPKGADKIDPATRSFQAIRIHINDELQALRSALKSSKRLLKENGRIIVVSFHSLEDAIVKEFITDNIKPKQSWSRHLPFVEEKQFTPHFKWLSKSAVKPSPQEEKSNPRSRSAKLRAAIRINKEVEYA